MIGLNSALLKSAALHSGLLVLLALSVEWQDEPQKTELMIQQPVIQAVAIDAAVVEAQQQRIEAQQQAAARAEQQRQAEITRQQQEAKRKRDEAAREKKRKLDEKRKKEAEQKKRGEDARKAEEQRKKDEAQKKQQEEQARKQREADDKKRREEEQRRKEEQARLEQQRQLEAERRAQEEAVARAARQQFVLTEKEKYTAKIQAAIQSYMIGDNSMYGRSCKVRIRLASTGFVTDFSVIQGDNALCSALKSAVYKVVEFEMPSDPEVNRELRDITLTFSPRQ